MATINYPGIQTIDVDEGPVFEQLAWQVIPEELLVEMAKLSIEDVAMYAPNS